ncbi:MAG: hypothetical protein ACSW8G_03035 [Bacillota bacterium]
MFNLDEHISEQFDYLKEYGYASAPAKRDHFSFICENNSFEVYIDRYGFQIDSYFNRGEDSFEANWAIEFADLDLQEYTASYQYHDDEGLKRGISKVSRSIKCLMNKIDMSREESFDLVFDYVNNKEEIG